MSKLENVQAALREYGAKHGTAHANRVMHSITGAIPLGEVNQADYAKIIAALKSGDTRKKAQALDATAIYERWNAAKHAPGTLRGMKETLL